MSKELAKQNTPEEQELSQKREELSKLQVLLVQRGVGFDTVENDRIVKQAFFYSMEESMGMLLSFLRVLRIHHIESQGIVTSVLLVLALVGAPAAGAQTFDEAEAAYKRGDYAVAFELFRTLAEQGHALAQTQLGTMYNQGHVMPRDQIEALRWYRRAAGQGDAGAQYNLGIMYANGQGVSQDYSEALRWYRQAAEQGNAEGQTRLGIMTIWGMVCRRITPRHYAGFARQPNRVTSSLRRILGLCFIWGIACRRTMFRRTNGLISRLPGIPVLSGKREIRLCSSEMRLRQK